MEMADFLTLHYILTVPPEHLSGDEDWTFTGPVQHLNSFLCYCFWDLWDFHQGLAVGLMDTYLPLEY